MITSEHRSPPAASNIEDLLLAEDEPPTVKLPTQEMKLGTLKRLDRTSEIVRPLQRLAPALSWVALVGGLVVAALKFSGSRSRKRTLLARRLR